MAETADPEAGFKKRQVYWLVGMLILIAIAVAIILAIYYSGGETNNPVEQPNSLTAPHNGDTRSDNYY